MAVSNTNTRIQVTIPKDIKEKLEERAKNNNRSVSNYVANLIMKDIKNDRHSKK